jgi:hypothetical protein
MAGNGLGVEKYIRSSCERGRRRLAATEPEHDQDNGQQGDGSGGGDGGFAQKIVQITSE